MKTMAYIFDTKVLEDKELFDKLYKKVPAYRQKKVDSYAGEAEKRSCLGTGLVFSHAIQEAGFELKTAHHNLGSNAYSLLVFRKK